MAIVDQDDVTAVRMLEQLCFLCSESITLPAIVWAGATGSISFHPACGTSFLLRLGRDLWQLEHDASDVRSVFARASL